MTDQALNDGTLSIVVRKVVKVKFRERPLYKQGSRCSLHDGIRSVWRREIAAKFGNSITILPLSTAHGSWSRAFDACFYVFVVSSIVFLLVETKSILFYSVSELLQSQ